MRYEELLKMYSILFLHFFNLFYISYFSFGKVFLVRPLSGPETEVYAMKVLRKSEVVKRQQVEHTKSERWILAEISVTLKFN